MADRETRHAPKRKRAARVAAPGAQRLELVGEVAVPDEHGRVRLLILDTGPDGRPDPSWGRLVAGVPRRHAEYQPPYEGASAGETAATGVRGVARITLPARRRQYWLDLAGSLRGKPARLEVTVRPFAFDAEDGARREGAALDLAMMEAVPRG
jgi:hypothetical protein